MIFGMFGKRSEARDDDTTEAILASFTGSPGAVLQQVIDWLDEQEAADKLDAGLLLKADARLENVLVAIEEDIVRQRRLGTGQKLLRTYCEHFGNAYVQLARRLPADDARQAEVRLRALHLQGRASRLARSFHEDRADLRRHCLALFGEAHRAGIATLRRPLRQNGPESSMVQELAITLLWETVPFDTLTQEQAEYLERLMNFHGQQIVLKTVVGATAPHAVLQGGSVVGPARVGSETPVLFVGPGPLTGHLVAALKLPDSADFPPWCGTPLPDTDIHTLRALAQRVTSAWERKSVQRGGERHARGDTTLVTGSFDNVRRAAAYATYVRSGGQLDVYAERTPIVSERIKEIMVGLEKDKIDLTPIEILRAMESMGESKAVETWAAQDSSPRGYNLAAPAYRPWLAVGGLIAVRETDSIDWRIGIVRRLYGTGGQRRAGIELLPGLPLAVGMGNEGKMEHVSIVDLRDALLVASEEAAHLIAPFECVPKGMYLLMGQGRRRCRIGELTHATADFRVYSCLLAATDGA